MKTTDEHLLGRWLDGELGPADQARFEAMMAADPLLREEAESLRKLGDSLRAHVTMERPVPNADFFNSQIQQRIAEAQRAEERVQSAAAPATSWLSWLRMPWAIGAAALLTLGVWMLQGEKPQTQILSLYAPKAGVQATSFHSEEANATVLMLDGLDSIPADKSIVGLSVHHSESDPEVATTTLFGENGEVLLVMTKDAASKPLFLGKKG